MKTTALAILLVMVGFQIAVADDVDPRITTFTTGVTVGPSHGGNSWPYTGSGTSIAIPRRSDDGTVGQFMDWRTLRLNRLASVAETKLENIQFGFDEDEIEQRYETDLDFVSRLLVENPEISLTLSGHTDLVGTIEYNNVLANRRAGAVRDALVGRGVPSSRLTTLGFGESSPLENIASALRANRRVEVEVTARVSASSD